MLRKFWFIAIWTNRTSKNPILNLQKPQLLKEAGSEVIIQVAPLLRYFNWLYINRRQSINNSV